MKLELKFNRAVLVAAVAVIYPLHAAAIDADAAEATLRREGCLKCHGVDKKKDGPSYRQVAAKYRGKPEAEDKLTSHVKSGRVVKMASGDEDEHRIIKSNDKNEIKNLVQWILSLE